MNKIVLIPVLLVIIGCVSAKLSGSGVKVQDSMHYIDVQANSINVEVNSNVK